MKIIEQSNPILWQPSAERIAESGMTAFMCHLARRAENGFAVDERQTPIENYQKLHRWSIEQMELFWRELWEFCEVKSTQMGITTLTQGHLMPGAKWFPDARLNFAENLLTSADESLAIIFRGEDRVEKQMTRAQLVREVAKVAAALRDYGVEEGDRVAAYMPNMPEVLIFMLATASIGAVFSSASPDFGVQGVMDRFAQINPKVLLTVDGYYYNGKTIDILDKVRAVSTQLSAHGLIQTVIVGYTREHPPLEGIHAAQTWQSFTARHPNALLPFTQLPFDHPLYIMFSSGTTGVPKCIIHTAGGALLQHLKEHRLHCDIRAGDRVFFFTTCGWMMWNWLVSALASRATLLLYDGSPLYQQGKYLCDYLQAVDCTHWGTSAKFIEAIAKNGLSPIATHSFKSLRTILSTGSTLTPEGFDFVYQHIKKEVCLSSISGGTDLLSCFVLGNPNLPVRRGVIQCRGLGMAVEVWAEDQSGKPQSVVNQAGELVCTAPFPSMPIGFLNDPGDQKYRAAYFETYPNVWCHGDYCEINEEGGVMIYGRSDATLNPGGVRIGTAEIYRQVEKLEVVVESLVVGQLWQGDERVILFVRLREGVVLDETIREAIKKVIRDNATSRHVPAFIVQVSDIPRTRSGKIVELAVKNILHDRPVKNVESLANPEALEFFRHIPALQT